MVYSRRMKRLLYVLGALGVVAVGVGLWLGYLALTAVQNPSGVVRGDETSIAPFWKGVELVVSPEGKLATWSKANGFTAVDELSNANVQSAAKSTDEKELILALKGGSMSIFWRYGESQQPRLLVATRGEVRGILSSPTRRSALVFQQGVKSMEDELLLLDTSTGTLKNIASNIRSASWMPDGTGIVATDKDQNVWFFGLRLNGEIVPPELITQSLDAAVLQVRKSDLVIARKTDQSVSLLTRSFLSGEENLVGDFSTDAIPLSVSVTPSSNGSLAILAFTAGEENGNLFLLLPTAGAIVQAGLTARRVAWLDDGGLLVERMQAGAVSLWYLEGPAKQAFPLDDDHHYRLVT